MIASQMGDTRYRGKLLWMLLTSRPDLLPIDLKRQGRAEVHLPLFSPSDDDEVAFMIKVMVRKNKATLADDAVPTGLAGRGLSGADIESIVLAAKTDRTHPGTRPSHSRGPRSGVERLHPVGARAGERETRTGRRPRMHVDVVPAGSVEGTRRPARRPGRTARTDGRDPPLDRAMIGTTLSREAATMSNEKTTGRTHWLDEKTETPLIDAYVQKLGSFLEAMADGRIDAGELKAQEERVATLMKTIEPELTTRCTSRSRICSASCRRTTSCTRFISSWRRGPKTKFRG